MHIQFVFEFLIYIVVVFYFNEKIWVIILVFF